MYGAKPFGWMFLCLCLTGCATHAVHVEAHGEGPDLKTAPTFAVDAPGDPSLAAAVTDRLRNRGLVEAQGGAPLVFVEVAFTDRPIRVGDYVGEGTADGRRQWLTAPERPGLLASPDARICSLTVRMSAPATGEELYRVRASDRPARRSCDPEAPRLLDAALGQIPYRPRR